MLPSPASPDYQALQSTACAHLGLRCPGPYYKPTSLLEPEPTALPGLHHSLCESRSAAWLTGFHYKFNLQLGDLTDHHLLVTLNPLALILTLSCSQALLPSQPASATRPHYCDPPLSP
jgi:hypothetical protein